MVDSIVLAEVHTITRYSIIYRDNEDKRTKLRELENSFMKSMGTGLQIVVGSGNWI